MVIFEKKVASPESWKKVCFAGNLLPPYNYQMAAPLNCSWNPVWVEFQYWSAVMTWFKTETYMDRIFRHCV